MSLLFRALACTFIFMYQSRSQVVHSETRHTHSVCVRALSSFQLHLFPLSLKPFPFTLTVSLQEINLFPVKGAHCGYIPVFLRCSSPVGNYLHSHLYMYNYLLGIDFFFSAPLSEVVKCGSSLWSVKISRWRQIRVCAELAGLCCTAARLLGIYTLYITTKCDEAEVALHTFIKPILELLAVVGFWFYFCVFGKLYHLAKIV